MNTLMMTIWTTGILATLLAVGCGREDTPSDNAQPLVDRINQLHGTHTVEYAEQIGLGTRQYTLVKID